MNGLRNPVIRPENGWVGGVDLSEIMRNPMGWEPWNIAWSSGLAAPNPPRGWPQRGMVDYINYMAPAIYPWNPQSLASSDSSNFQKTQKPCAGVHGPNEHDGPEPWRKHRGG